jgi:RNA exonuclease 1
MLENVTTTLQDIQQKLVTILHPRSVLIGHSLNSDFNALKLTHPFIIDTAVIFPHPRGPPLKSSLKWLAKKYLNREIQKGHGTTGPGAGHDSIEDARTCLDLVKQKCEKGKEWGTSDSAGENIFKRVARTGVKYKNRGGSAIPSPINGKSSAMVDWGDPKKGAGAAATHIIGCKSDEEVVEGVIRAVKGDHDGKDIPGGGVDFVFGRLRELEALKGWWNNNKTVAPVEKPVTAESKEPDPATVVEESITQEPAEVAGDEDNGFRAHPSVNETSKSGLTLDLVSATTVAAVSEVPAEKVLVEEPAFVEVSVVEVPSIMNPVDISALPETSPNTVVDDPPLSSVPLTSSLPPPSLPETPIISATSKLTSHIQTIYAALPPCTAFIIYSGSGDPREMSRLQAMQTQFKKEYKIKKWDQLSVKWTDTEEQALKRAVREARNGIAFMSVK